MPPAVAGCSCQDTELLIYFYNIMRQRGAYCQAEYLVGFESAHVFGERLILVLDRT